jgi:hypothetical protein
MYTPIHGGFQIKNGRALYTRPLYSSNISYNRMDRYLFFTGDKPKIVLKKAGDDWKPGSAPRYAYMFFGIKGGKWLDQMDNITSRYVFGHEEYEITDASFEDKIKLTMVRPDLFDGLIIKAELPDSVKGKFVTAVAATGGATGGTEFSPSEAANTSVTIHNNTFAIKKTKMLSSLKALEKSTAYKDNTFIAEEEKIPAISGVSNVSFEFSARDAKIYNSGSVDEFLASYESDTLMVAGVSKNNEKNELYFLLTTDSLVSASIQEFVENPQIAFESGIKYFKRLTEKVSVNTPDPYLNSTIDAQMIGMDASWSGKTLMHGSYAWYTPFSGWRNAYGETTAGFTDRIKTNAKAFYSSQSEDKYGRISDFPTRDIRYNMGEVMVDQILYNWLWDGDLDFMKNEGGYDFVKKFLSYQDQFIKVPGTNLYENWLNAWNTDNKWNNGGISTISSCYMYRANEIMADIAKRIGKTEDAQVFKEKADVIKADLKSELWVEDIGVYAEYKDRFGKELLHTIPDLSSIYTPIDVGVADKLETYQMLRFIEVSIDRIENFPRDAVFSYSSNWLPLIYSSNGLYPGEVINTVLAYYKSGQREKAYELFKGVQTSLFKGEKAGPGLSAHILSADLENTGHTDFSDVTSQVIRTVVEGTFGIMMHMPNETVKITPGLLPEWNDAAINTEAIGYTYKYANNIETFNVRSQKALVYKMSIPAKGSKVAEVKVNGRSVSFEVTSNVEFETEKMTNAVIEILYANNEIATVSNNEVGAVNSGYTVTSNGVITKVIDPQMVVVSSVGLNSGTVKVMLADKTGDHTFFVEVEKDDMISILPVYVEIKRILEVTDMAYSKNQFTFKLQNNSEKSIAVSGRARVADGNADIEDVIDAGSYSQAFNITLTDRKNMLPGNNLVKLNLSGDFTGEITSEFTDWTLTADTTKMTTINLDNVVNQNLMNLHKNSYDITYEDDKHFVLPRFYFVSDVLRTVKENGRSWWERGADAVPTQLELPDNGGIYNTDIGVPVRISSVNGNNAAFVSLYNQFPDKINIPVETNGSKVYFMLSVSTNHMQSYVDNAKITVNMNRGKKELSLVNPINIDDWLNYQTKNPYAKSGYIQSLGDKGHSNILAIDLGREEYIMSVDIECISNEVLCGLIGMTVATNGQGFNSVEL